jgi:hypothetical protein
MYYLLTDGPLNNLLYTCTYQISYCIYLSTFITDDHSRVILQGNASSDYINASYIDVSFLFRIEGRLLIPQINYDYTCNLQV